MVTIAQALQSILADPQHWERIDNRRAKQQAALIARGWPPPFSLPVKVFDAITEWAADNSLSNAEFDQAVVDAFAPSVVASMLREWKSNLLLASRTHILEEVVTLYTSGYYAGAIALLLPQIEGAIGSAVRRQPNAQNDARLIFRDTRLSSVAREFYIAMAKASFTWREAEPIPELSRNAILHGRDATFGTAPNALKCILVFDAVQEGLRTYSQDSEDDAESAPD
jgi:hypothetical protein